MFEVITRAILGRQTARYQIPISNKILDELLRLTQLYIGEPARFGVLGQDISEARVVAQEKFGAFGNTCQWPRGGASKFEALGQCTLVAGEAQAKFGEHMSMGASAIPSSWTTHLGGPCKNMSPEIEEG